MSTPPPARPPLGSAAEQAAELNERIRAFWIDGRGHPTVGLTEQQREEYQGLLAELWAVEYGGVVEAA